MTAATHISLDDYRALLSVAFDERVVAWTVKAEEEERFPRHLIEVAAGMKPDHAAYAAEFGRQLAPPT